MLVAIKHPLLVRRQALVQHGMEGSWIDKVQKFLESLLLFGRRKQSLGRASGSVGGTAGQEEQRGQQNAVVEAAKGMHFCWRALGFVWRLGQLFLVVVEAFLHRVRERELCQPALLDIS